MTVESVRAVAYELTASFFRGATVLWAEQINTKPEPPYVTIKTGNITRSRFPIIENDGTRYYPCSVPLEINLYTKGKAVTIAPNVTGNYSNSAASDLNDFFTYLDSETVVDRIASYGMDISLEPPVRDLTDLQNESRYRYRAMAEATVSFAMEADGAYGLEGRNLPNSSGGGTEEMAKTELDSIEEVKIEETT